jgi:hypothetical protein
MSKFLAAATALFIPLSGQAIVAPAAADTITMTITGTVAPYQFHSGLLGLVMLGTRNISLPPLCCSFPYQRTHKHPQPVNMHQLAHSRHIQCRKMNSTAWKPRAASSADKDIRHANHAQLWPKPNPRFARPLEGEKTL